MILRQLTNLLAVVVALSFTAHAFASSAGPRRGWTKVLITPVSPPSQEKPSPAELRGAIVAAGGVNLHTYGDFTLAYFPEHALNNLPAAAAQHMWSYERRDDFDIVELPGRIIDTRLIGRGSSAPLSTKSLYVVQLIGPATLEWIGLIKASGVSVLQAVPQNAYIVAATADEMVTVSALPFVQWWDRYDRGMKLPPPADGKEPRHVIVQIAPVTGYQIVIERIAIQSSGQIQVQKYHEDLLVDALLSGNQVASLLDETLVIGIYPKPNPQLSDERQALSVSAHVSADGNQPLNPGQYAAWLAGICPTCTNLASDGFSVGIVDSGLDTGGAAPQHQDLAGRQAFGATFAANADACGATCDARGHGTMVAGIIAGNAGTQQRDAGQFFLGMGIAPSARIFSTKIFSAGGGVGASTVFDWAHDARSNGVAIQITRSTTTRHPGTQLLVTTH